VKTARDWTATFLDAYRAGGVVSLAATAAGVDRTTPYARRKADPAFAAAWDAAEEEATDVLVAEARRRALDSSDTLLIFLLKSHRPAVYRERYDVHHGGRVTHDHELRADLARLSLEDLRALEAVVIRALPDAAATAGDGDGEPTARLPGPGGD
jgi:hypothetical protein